jgi:hypothetical protein
MQKNPEAVREFEKSYARKQASDYHRKSCIFEDLFLEARGFGVFPLKDPLDGIEVDIRLAKALNVQTTSRNDRQQP